MKPTIFLAIILLVAILGAFMPQIEEARGALQVASSTFTTASVRDANRMWLGGELDHNWFATSGAGSAWGANHTFGRLDDDSIFNVVPAITGFGVRSEGEIKLEDFMTANEFYVSVWSYLPSDWTLDTSADYDWYELFNPLVLHQDANYYPRFVVHIGHTSGQWSLRLKYYTSIGVSKYIWYPRSVGWDINEVLGVWTHYEWWIYRSNSTGGEIKFWMNGVKEVDSTTGTFDMQTKLSTGYVGDDWFTVPNKSYYNAAVGKNNVKHIVYMDDLEIWDGLPEEGEDTTSPTISNVAHNTTIAAMPARFSARWMDDNALSGFIFSKKEGAGAWINDTWTALTGSIAWANATKTLPGAGTTVYYRWFCNDTSNNWATSSTYSFATTALGTNIVVLLNIPTDNSTAHTKSVDFQYIIIFYQTPQNVSLWSNVTGSWAKQFTSGTITNNTVRTITVGFDAAAVETIIWNIGVANTTHNVFGASNRTLYVDVRPYYSDQNYSTNVASAVCEFTVIWYDGDGLSHYIFSNNVGGWHNTSSTAWGETINQAQLSFTETLPAVVGTTVSFRFYVKDTDNNWVASSTSSLTTTIGSDEAIGEYSYGEGTDALLIYLLDGDILGFTIAVYTSKIGMAFYGILILIVSGIFYNRTKSLAFLSLIWILLGGVFIAVTWIFSPIAIVLLALGLTGIIYQLVEKEST